MNPEKPARLGEILLQARIIDRLQLNTALKYQREWDRKLGEALVELGFISESVLVKVLSKFLQVPTVELPRVHISPSAIQKVPRRIAEKYGLIPLDTEGEEANAELVVAMIDPTNMLAIDEIAFFSGCKIKPVVASQTDIEQAIRRHYGDERIVDVFFEPTLPPLARREAETTKNPRTPDLSQLPPQVVTSALLRVLLSKGLLTLEEFHQEVSSLMKKEP